MAWPHGRIDGLSAFVHDTAVTLKRADRTAGSMDDCRARPNTWFAPSLRPFVFSHLLKFLQSIRPTAFSTSAPTGESAVNLRQMTIFDHIERCVAGLRDVGCNHQATKTHILGWMSDLEIEMRQQAARLAALPASTSSHAIPGSFPHADSGFVGKSTMRQIEMVHTVIQIC